MKNRGNGAGHEPATNHQQEGEERKRFDNCRIGHRRQRSGRRQCLSSTRGMIKRAHKLRLRRVAETRQQPGGDMAMNDATERSV